MKRLILLWVSFWIMLLLLPGYVQAQGGNTTPNLGLQVPSYEPGTWGEQIANDLLILDSKFPGGGSLGGVPDTTCAAGTKVSSFVGNVPTCTPTTLLNQSVNLVGVISPPQIVANTNDYAPANLATASTLYINTDASRNLTGITGGATGRVLFIYNNGTQNIVLVNESGLSTAINRLAINANITLGPAQGIIIQYDATATRWRAASGVSGAGGQAADNDLTALAALSGTGIAVRSAADTWIQRSITGVSGEIAVTNGDGVAANPSIGVGTDVIKRNQANTYSGAGLQDMSANELRIFNGAAYAPTAEGRIGVNTTNHKPVIGLNGATQNIAIESGNIATATALAANGTNGAIATADFALGVDASGNAETGKVARSGSSAPGVTPDFDGQTYQDTRAYNCSTGAGLPYMARSGNFISIASVQDGYVTFTDGTNSASPCGSDTFKFEASTNIAPTVTSGSPDKVVHKIVVGSEARGDLMVRGASDWGRFAPGSAGDCFKSGGAAADPTWGACSTVGVKAYWEADSIIADGTNCTDPTTVTINSGPTTRAFVCADSNSSVFQGKVQLPSAITTAVFTLTISDVDSSSQVFAVNVDAECRNTTTTINGTFGTAQSIAITMVTANVLYTGASAAVTPNGTCGAGATLFWRATVLGTTTNTDNGNARILSMFMAGS